VGQQEVYNILKRNKNKYFSFKELSAKLGVNCVNVSRACRSLSADSDIDFVRSVNGHKIAYVGVRR